MVCLRSHLPMRRCKRHSFSPRVRKIPWRRKWQPTSVFLPENFHEQRSLVGYSPCGCKESDTTEQLNKHTYVKYISIKRGWLQPAQRAQPRGAAPRPRSGAAAMRSCPTSEVRSGSREELPHVQGQEQQPWGAAPRPRSGSCEGAGGPRGAIPCSRSGGAAVRRYPSSKVRSSRCALLEQLWRDSPRPR